MRALAVVVLMSLVSPAWAIKPPPPGYGRAARPSCDVQPSITPANGARGVARNAHAWITAGTLGDYRLRHGVEERRLQPITHAPFRVIELPLGLLEPATTYSLVYGDDVLSTFTTGAEIDAQPPHPPRFIDASVLQSFDTSVALLLTSHDDTAMMKLTVYRAHRKHTIVAPESTLREFGGECAGLLLERDEWVCFEAVELDLAGNSSAAATQCTRVDVFRRGHPRYHEPSSMALLWPLAVILLAFPCLLSFATATLRNGAARNAFAESPHTPIATELVGHVARAQRRTSLHLLVASIAALAIVAWTLATSTAVLVATFPVTAALIVGHNLLRQHRVLRRLATSSPTYDERHHVFIDARDWLVVYPGQLQRATSAAIPAAKVR